MIYPLEWDEAIHLNSALTLQSGNFVAYLDTAFYPPLFDSATALSFSILGVGLFSARLVSVLFSVLSLWVVFEFTSEMYGKKAGLLSTVLLGIMPGYFWMSRMALLETTLLFFFTLALLFFYRWLQNKQTKYIFLCGLAVGFGILTKYQMLVTLLIIAVSIVFLARGQLRSAFSRFALLIATSVAVVVPWIAVAYQVYASKILEEWFYALQVGNPEKFAYSGRYPAPIFYLIEMVWPYEIVHPLSIFLYGAGLTGLVFFALRHNRPDNYLLIWFLSTFVFFTLITNKEWRYVLPLFPVLAIATAILVLFGYRKLALWKKQAHISSRHQQKVVAAVFVVLVAGAMAYSVYDAYVVTAYYDVSIELETATLYAMNHMQNNQSIMVLCPFNFFSQDMISFYLAKNGNPQIPVSQYPSLPVDTYTPNFNVNTLIALCRQNNVKYVFTYENGGTTTYYNTTLNLVQVYEQLYASGNFSEWTDEEAFGLTPRRIIILTFLG
ncbi:MAG TPA: glycosyltransferase family 39 protein [Candidatus Deferrimicrobiaceae bacterium]|nr:glycosyltransferase family 39 protein [Candidatus Deferrimicrobiaceae bacterium]